MRWIERSTASLLTAALAVALPVTNARAATRYVFVTSSEGTGNFSNWPGNLDGGLTGLAAANKICQNTAASSTIPAIAANAAAYRAWISTSTTDAFCNVLGFTGTKASACGGSYTNQKRGPWLRPDGTPWAGNLEALTSESEVYDLQFFDENGVDARFTDTQHWTGTGASGTVAADTCVDWGSADAGQFGSFGRAPITSGQFWTSWSASSCDSTYRLFCVEGAAGDPIPTDHGIGALAFITSTTGTGNLASWTGSGGSSGLAGADNVCRARALAADLPEPDSFVAWLSTTAVDAKDRITTNGPFRRVDGPMIASSKADLLDGLLATSLAVTDLGTYLPAPNAYTGTSIAGVDTGANCTNWTNPAINVGATFGQASLASNNWTTYFQTASCDTANHLYCFSNTLTLFREDFEKWKLARWSSTRP